MDTQNLQTFLLVAEQGSFSLAAERLHLTQPAVSKRIALLEQQLQCALFDRIGRHVGLTEAGRALRPYAEAMVQQWQQASQAVRDLSGEVSGELRLATSHHIGLHRLPPVLSDFSRRYPAVHIDIDFLDSEQAHDLILQDKVELAVVTLAPGGDASMIATPIWRDPLAFMAAPGHPLARSGAPTLRELASYPAVLPGLGTYTGQIVKALFREHHLGLQVSMATNYLETIRMMASVGLGWTVLPASMLDASLQVLPVPGVSVERSLGTIYHRGRSLSRAARAFLVTLGDNAGTTVPGAGEAAVTPLANHRNR